MRATILGALLLLLGLAPPAEPQAPTTPNCTGSSSAISATAGFQQITISTGANGLTPPAGAVVAVVIVEGNPVRYRDDGTVPTATVGMPVAPGNGLMICSKQLATFRVIRSGNADAVLNVSYYGP